MKKKWLAISISLLFLIILLLLIFSPDETYQEQESLDKDYFTELYFYESNTNCSLSGKLSIGNFNTNVVDGYYNISFLDYQNINNFTVILSGVTDYCFGDDANLPYYVVWESDYITDYSDYTFEATFNPRWPTEPQAMQGFIRPEEVEERYQRISIDEDETDLENLERIFSTSYMNWVSDPGRFGEVEYWQTPNDFIQSNGGDCEDWAIYMESLIKRYNSDLNCYLAIWHTHVNILCDIENKFIILDQEKIRKNLVLDNDSSLQENQIKVRSWRNNYFEEYGISSDERMLYYLIDNDEIIYFEDGKEDFINWVLKRGGII